MTTQPTTMRTNEAVTVLACIVLFVAAVWIYSRWTVVPWQDCGPVVVECECGRCDDD